MHLCSKIITVSLMGVLMGPLTGCASLGATADPKTERVGLTPRILASGDCGLFVWKADQAKTFILYVDNKNAVFYQNGSETVITPAEKADIPTERLFTDSNGQKMSLSLREAQTFQESTRYKSGSITNLDANGWETVIPVVGLYSCQT